jgi:hypothetical protein
MLDEKTQQTGTGVKVKFKPGDEAIVHKDISLIFPQPLIVTIVKQYQQLPNGTVNYEVTPKVPSKVIHEAWLRKVSKLEKVLK